MLAVFTTSKTLMFIWHDHPLAGDPIQPPKCLLNNIGPTRWSHARACLGIPSQIWMFVNVVWNYRRARRYEHLQISSIFRVFRRIWYQKKSAAVVAFDFEINGKNRSPTSASCKIGRPFWRAQPSPPKKRRKILNRYVLLCFFYFCSVSCD